MARPLRIRISGGRYHVTAQGNQRRSIFRADRDWEHFLGLLDQLPEGFGMFIHAYGLRPNHVHHLVETREDNTRRLTQDRKLDALMQKLQNDLSNVEI
jgi:putative transposase